jgi:hypothetical protein
MKSLTKKILRYKHVRGALAPPCTPPNYAYAVGYRNVIRPFNGRRQCAAQNFLEQVICWNRLLPQLSLFSHRRGNSFALEGVASMCSFRRPHLKKSITFRRYRTSNMTSTPNPPCTMETKHKVPFGSRNNNQFLNKNGETGGKQPVS